MRISVVIPTFHEAARVGAAIASARATLGDCEVIVVDAESDDGTATAARTAGARVVVAAGTRGEAMNAGARIANGGALLFLHADTTLPDGAGDAVRVALGTADGGAFRLRFDDRRPVLEAFTHLRGRFFRPVYGDQAIFVVRTTFDRLGGYRPLAIMEDYDLVSRLRSTGRFTLLDLPVETAARRHRDRGALRTVTRIWAIQCLYHLGVPPARLARYYPPATAGQEPRSQPQ